MKLVVFDYETGGILPEHPNIQLAAIAVDDDWNEVDSFERKIAFDPSLCHPEALKVNHYDPEKWADAMFEPDCFREFASFLKKHASVEMISKRTGSPYKVAKLAAYNAPFDKERLWAMSQGQFVPAHPQALCVMQLSLWASYSGVFKTDSFRLTEVNKALGLPEVGGHDALVDVRMTAAVAKEILRRNQDAKT